MILKRAEKEALEVENETVRKIFIPTIFGGEYGPDLEDVARQHNMKPEEIVLLSERSL